MWKQRIFNRTTLAGLGSWLLAVLPFMESNGMNPTVIALVGIGLILVIYGLVEKPQRRLRRSELDSLIEQREAYLLPLKATVGKMLKMTDRLAIEAGKYPLKEYQKRYLPFHKHKRPLQIQNALVKRKFIWNNHYYQLLKDQDKDLQLLRSDYNTCYSQVRDNKLRKYLKKLWATEHSTGSLKAFSLLARGTQEIPHTATGLNIARIGESTNKQDIDNAIGRVNMRISELLDGAEDD